MLSELAPPLQVAEWYNAPTPLTLEQLRGQVVLLHAFQMLCPGCVSHGVPQAERVHREYQQAGVQVIGLHSVFEHHQVMNPEALQVFLHEYRITHPVAIDQPQVGNPIPQTMARYGLRGTPSVLLIDRQGRLRLSEFGRMDDLRLGMVLGQLLAEPAAEVGCDEQGCRIRDSV